MTRHPLAPAAALVAATAIMAGCTTATPLRINDHQTISSLRAVHRFGSGPGGGGLEASLSGQRGQAQQALAAGDRARINDIEIVGPATMAHRAEALHAQLAYNHRLFAGGPVELEWFAGVASHRLDWQTAAGAAAAPVRLRESWVGPAGGVAGRVRLGPQLAAALRYDVAMDGRGFSAGHQALELVLAWAPVPAWELRAGFAQSRSWVQSVSPEADLELRSSSPFLGLALNF